MKLKLLIILLSVTGSCFSQNAQHIKVPGTKCSIVPPAGFEVASTFGGFQNQELGASIVIMEIPGPFEEIMSGFTAEKLESKGMTILSKDTLRFNNLPAHFYTMRQTGGDGNIYKKQILVFGSSSNTVMVNGIYPEKSNSIDGKMKESLMSTIYDNTVIEDPLDAAVFTLDVKGTEFKVVKYMMGSLLYSVDGQIPTDKATLMAGTSSTKITGEDKKQFALGRFKNLPNGNGSTIKETNEVVIDGMSGYEIIAYNGAGLLYEVMLFSESGHYFIIVGQTKEEKDKYLKVYKQIAKTFKRK